MNGYFFLRHCVYIYIYHPGCPGKSSESCKMVVYITFNNCNVYTTLLHTMKAGDISSYPRSFNNVGNTHIVVCIVEKDGGMPLKVPPTPPTPLTPVTQLPTDRCTVSRVDQPTDCATDWTHQLTVN